MAANTRGGHEQPGGESRRTGRDEPAADRDREWVSVIADAAAS